MSPLSSVSSNVNAKNWLQTGNRTQRHSGSVIQKNPSQKSAGLFLSRWQDYALLAQLQQLN